jgi:hypothetical protein
VDFFEAEFELAGAKRQDCLALFEAGVSLIQGAEALVYLDELIENDIQFVAVVSFDTDDIQMKRIETPIHRIETLIHGIETRVVTIHTILDAPEGVADFFQDRYWNRVSHASSDVSRYAGSGQSMMVGAKCMPMAWTLETQGVEGICLVRRVRKPDTALFWVHLCLGSDTVVVINSRDRKNRKEKT